MYNKYPLGGCSMKKLKFIDNETLDDAVTRLIQQRNNNNHVFLEFNGVKLFSDTVSIDDAYKQVCGCTKEEFEKRISSTTPAKIDIEDSFKSTAANAIRDVKMSKLLFLTKGGKIYSNIANEYIDDVSKYSIYCKEDKQDEWIATIRKLIYMSGEVEDYLLLSELSARENAGMIMESISNNMSLADISKIVKSQGHTGSSISLLGQIMLQYSPMGVEFVENVIGIGWIKTLDCLNEKYQKVKKAAKKY
ncbi:MAG: hypothetical protein IJ068_02830 [Bacilli bacterium]|nr:hypothetical protein [Bacilli bacterium]